MATDPPPEWTCTHCGRPSWNPNDRINQWCGACEHYCDLADLVAELKLEGIVNDRPDP